MAANWPTLMTLQEIKNVYRPRNHLVNHYRVCRFLLNDCVAGLDDSPQEKPRKHLPQRCAFDAPGQGVGCRNGTPDNHKRIAEKRGAGLYYVQVA